MSTGRVPLQKLALLTSSYSTNKDILVEKQSFGIKIGDVKYSAYFAKWVVLPEILD